MKVMSISYHIYMCLITNSLVCKEISVFGIHIYQLVLVYKENFTKIMNYHEF